MGETIKVNKNIHGVAVETQLTTSNLTNYAIFSDTWLYEHRYKTSEEVYLFRPEEGY